MENFTTTRGTSSSFSSLKPNGSYNGGDIMNKNLILVVTGLTLISIALMIPGASTLQVLVFAGCGALAGLISKIK
jgi:hypothetical protein